MYFMSHGIILISEKAPPRVIRALQRYGEVRLLPPYERLPAPVMSHCDMLMCRCRGRLFVWHEYFAAHQELFDGVPDAVRPVSGKPSYLYPGDIGLDLLTMLGDSLCFGHETAADEVRRDIEENGGRFVPVRQGYTRCSVLKVTDDAVITADESIARETAKRNIDTLVISPGGIALEGYDHGFIGGASGNIDGKIVFFGDLSSHRDARQISEFITKHGMSAVSLCDGELFDLGGMYYYEDTHIPQARTGYKVNNGIRGSSDKDDFWNIDMVAPKKRLTGFSNNTDAVLIELPSVSSRDTSERRREIVDAAVSAGLERVRQRREQIGSRGSAPSEAMSAPVPKRTEPSNDPPISEYKPDNPLITSVSVMQWHTRYTFYDRFAADAERYFHAAPPPRAVPTPFFSYMPQYSQMDRRQLAWYLAWRGMVRNGEYPETDFSYIMLLIAETVNLPHLITPKDGLDLLTAVWINYRSVFEKLDGIMTETVTDWCLINALDPPVSALGGDVSAAAVKISRFPEFWQASDAKDVSSAAVEYLIRRCSKYDYRRSKFYIGGDDKVRSVYDRDIKGAVDAAYEAGALGSVRCGEVPYSRSSYANISCAWKNHRRIAVRYLRFDASADVCAAVSDAVRYAENKVRALTGVKARLGVRPSDALSAPIDTYFAPLEAENINTKPAKTSAETEYDRWYEPLHEGFSAQRAAEIERSSWSVTDALTAAFADDDDAEDTDKSALASAEADETESYADPADDAPNEGEREEPDGTARKAASCLIRGDQDGFRSLAKENNMLPEALLDLLNETLYGVIGDAAAEYDGEIFSLVEDYREDIEAWMSGA